MNLSTIFGAASTVPGPQQAPALALAVVPHLVSVGSFTVSGSTVSVKGGTFGTTDLDRARQARAQAYLTGALYGDVTSIQLALWTSTKVGAAAEKQLYQAVLAAMAAAVPSLYNQAVAAGGMIDHEDGQLGLNELLVNGIHFSMPGAGHPTGDYNRTDPATLDIVSQLAALPLTPSGVRPAVVRGTTVLGTTQPAGSAPTTPGTTARAATPSTAGPPSWLGFGLIAAIIAAVLLSRGVKTP